MNKRTRSAICLLLFQVSLSSCQKDQEVTPSPVEETVPLQVGNEWVYRVTDYGTNADTLTTSYIRSAVLKDTLIQKSIWYVLSNGSIVQNSREGFVYYNLVGQQPVIIYQSPDYGGIGYMYEYPHFELWVMTTRSQQQDTLTTSAAAFASYRFRIEKQHKSPDDPVTHIINQDDYVSPGVGLVRTDIYYVDSEKIRQRQELVRYTLR